MNYQGEMLCLIG
uniref:Uncharacterized protein n=1 Tax=Anguilla anguilla TaxID=7936 RepID=A0A0E9QFE0_ANGAN